MADEKVVAAVKTEEVKKEEVKKAVAKKPVAKKPAAEKAVAEKKAPAKKAEKAVAEKKAPAKKAAKKAAAKANVFVQFAGKSFSQDELVKIAQDVWQYDMNKKAEDFKTVDIYVKPEENKAYFVVNGETSGSFDL